MTIDLLTKITRAKDQVSCALGDEVAILNMQSASYFGLGGIGSFVWATIETERTVQNICARVLEEFDVSEFECRRDVVEFLTELRQIGLIETSK